MGVTKVVLSRRTISWVTVSPACSRSLTRSALALALAYSSVISSSTRDAETMCPACCSNRSKNFSSRGSKRNTLVSPHDHGNHAPGSSTQQDRINHHSVLDCRERPRRCQRGSRGNPASVDSLPAGRYDDAVKREESAMARRARCPHCGREVVWSGNPHRPFCSL